jgi:hypothetical protein
VSKKGRKKKKFSLGLKSIRKQKYRDKRFFAMKQSRGQKKKEKKRVKEILISIFDDDCVFVEVKPMLKC